MCQKCFIYEFGEGKPQKKVIFLMARPGQAIKRGGGEAGPLRNFIFICCYLKIKDILLMTTNQNTNTGNVGKVIVFIRFVAIFGTKYGSFRSKIVGRKKVVKTCFRLF